MRSKMVKRLAIGILAAAMALTMVPEVSTAVNPTVSALAKTKKKKTKGKKGKSKSVTVKVKADNDFNFPWAPESGVAAEIREGENDYSLKTGIGNDIWVRIDTGDFKAGDTYKYTVADNTIAELNKKNALDVDFHNEFSVVAKLIAKKAGTTTISCVRTRDNKKTVYPNVKVTVKPVTYELVTYVEDADYDDPWSSPYKPVRTEIKNGKTYTATNDPYITNYAREYNDDECNLNDYVWMEYWNPSHSYTITANGKKLEMTDRNIGSLEKGTYKIVITDKYKKKTKTLFTFTLNVI